LEIDFSDFDGGGDSLSGSLSRNEKKKLDLDLFFFFLTSVSLLPRSLFLHNHEAGGNRRIYKRMKE
jgi:hypothetical protein